MNKVVELSVNKETKHIKNKAKWYITFYEYFRKILNFAIGAAISWYLFDKCLFCKDCNTAVIIHLSILSFICFVNCGIPVDRILSINSVTGG